MFATAWSTAVVPSHSAKRGSPYMPWAWVAMNFTASNSSQMAVGSAASTPCSFWSYGSSRAGSWPVRMRPASVGSAWSKKAANSGVIPAPRRIPSRRNTLPGAAVRLGPTPGTPDGRDPQIGRLCKRQRLASPLPRRGIGPNSISNQLRNMLSLNNSRDGPDATRLQQRLETSTTSAARRSCGCLR